MSLPRYGGYKASGVQWLGRVPEHWRVMPIRFAARLESGHTPSRSRPDWWVNCTVPWFTLADVAQIRQGGADVIYDTKEKVSELGLQNSSARRLPAGTVMLSRTASVGFAAIMGVEMATTQDFANWVCGPSLSPKFLLLVFRSMRSELERLMMGSTHNTIYMPDIAALHFALPPLEEQEEIVSFLEIEVRRIDSLIAEQERLVALLDEKRQATISYAVTRGLDPTAATRDLSAAGLGVTPSHWKVAALKRFWTVTDCKHLTAEYVDEGFPLASIREVQSRYVTLAEAKLTTTHFYEQLIEGGRKPMPGDLIFSRNATVGEVAQVTVDHPPFAMGQDVCLLRKSSPELSSDYLQAVMRSSVVTEQLKNIMTGSTFKRVNVEDIRNLCVAMPPQDEQKLISEFISNVSSTLDQLRVETKRAVDLLNERRSALIAAAVTGQIDVRGIGTRQAEVPALVV
jgi:type I restriction enzyme S subunit